MSEKEKVICASQHEVGNCASYQQTKWGHLNKGTQRLYNRQQMLAKLATKSHVGVAWYHPNGEKVSVTVPAVNKRNGVTYTKTRKLYNRRQMFAKLVTKVAGRMGERKFLAKKGKCSSSVDYSQAKYIAQLIVTKYDNATKEIPYITKQKLPMDRNVKRQMNTLIADAERFASQILDEHSQQILAGAADLAQTRFLSFNAIYVHLGPPVEED
ncbi:hypothetical protein niasHS_013711 [Heterodera schachtii]|uniref:Uncharacterized protein n=1 Tax=Heterodera schachtii TaxID=97005 RepID=A0ABD2IN15_HETSC